MTKPTPDLPILDGDAITKIEARASAASAGPWKVYKTPFTLTELGRQQGFKEDRKSVVNAIGQTWDHPQLKGPMAIVTTTHGPYYDPQHAVKIEDDDADFIAHAREDVPALCHDWRVLRAALSKADEIVIEAIQVKADLQSQLEQVTKERDTARELVTRLTIEKQKLEKQLK